MIRSSNRKKIRHCNFMQAFLAAAHDPKAAVVLHNTRACSNIALTAYRALRERPTKMAKSEEGGDNLFSTALDDRDAIFGGEEKLAACLTDICAVRHPDYILVACGCVPGVTGDDAAAVCRAVREKTGVPILLLPGQGFMVPEDIDMTLAAADLLFEEFTYPRRGEVPPVSDMAVLVGSGAYYIEAPIFAELRAFFDVFGITRLYTPPGGMTKADYEALPAARVAAALSMGVVKKDASVALAEKFAARLHMPLLNLNEIDSPEELAAAVRDAGEKLGQRTAAEAYVEAGMRAYQKPRAAAQRILTGKRCLVAAGLPFQIFQPHGIIRWLKSLDLTVRGFFLPSIVSEVRRKEYQAFTAAQYPEMICCGPEAEETAADFLVTTRETETNLPQFRLLPQHFTFAGWGDEAARLAAFLAGGVSHGA